VVQEREILVSMEAVQAGMEFYGEGYCKFSGTSLQDGRDEEEDLNE